LFNRPGLLFIFAVRFRRNALVNLSPELLQQIKPGDSCFGRKIFLTVLGLGVASMALAIFFPLGSPYYFQLSFLFLCWITGLRYLQKFEAIVRDAYIVKQFRTGQILALLAVTSLVGGFIIAIYLR